MQRKINTK